MKTGKTFDAESAIACIEEAARQERIAGSNTQDCDDPEPAREAIRRWYEDAMEWEQHLCL